MQFERRDIILLLGATMMALGLAPFIPLIYGILVAAGIFFGIKVYSLKRRQQILKETGHGICAECGSALGYMGCPKCGK